MPASAVVGTTLRLTRTLPASRERVFRAWTDPEQLRQWLTPIVGGSSPSAEVDLRVGGVFRVKMKLPGWVGGFTGTYLEVVPPQRLVFTWEAEGMRRIDVGETRVTVEFHDHGEQTEVVLVHERNPTRGARAFHSLGWRRALRRLESRLRRTAA